MSVVTIAERKRRSAEKLAAAAAAVMAELTDYARSTAGSGRFIVFGSAAAEAIRYDSDFDASVDFRVTMRQRRGGSWRKLVAGMVSSRISCRPR